MGILRTLNDTYRAYNRHIRIPGSAHGFNLRDLGLRDLGFRDLGFGV